MKNLLIASNNKHKIEEIKLSLSPFFDNISTLDDEGIVCDPDETGKDFYENALIKARSVAMLTDKPVLADDTGLCVDALNGCPGVHSARYAVLHNGEANRRKLLSEMEGVTDRAAHFETVAILLYPDGEIVCGKGRVDGYILTEERGDNGFGYDSIFFSTELNKTFGEASADEKLTVSHRGRALNDLLNKISRRM